MTELRRRSLVRWVHRVQAGAAGGLVAGGVVAAFFFLVGAIDLHPLAVPASLASGLFGGGGAAPGVASPPESFVVLAVEMLAYTAIHLLAFTGVGASAGMAVKASTFWRTLLSSTLYVTVACTGLLYLAGWFVATPVAVDVLGLPRVLLANAVAGTVIGTALYLQEQSDAREMTV